MSKEERMQTLGVDRECVISIESTSGNVRVVGWDESQVQVEGHDRPPAIRQEGNRLIIKATAGGSSDVEAKVPRGAEVALHSISGDVRLRDMGGKITIQTTSGDIDGKRLHGELQVRTVSGDLVVRNSHLSGLEIDTVSGDSRVETTLQASGVFRLRSVSGELELSLPEGQPCTLQLQSLSGDLACELPHQSKRQGWGKLEAQINGGGPTFQVNTASGDVLVNASHKIEEEEVGEQEAVADTALPSKPSRQPVERAALPSEVSPQGTRKTRPLSEAPGSPQEPFALDDAGEPVGQARQDSAPTMGQGHGSSAAQRMEILKAIEEGKISVSEGLARLRKLE